MEGHESTDAGTGAASGNGAAVSFPTGAVVDGSRAARRLAFVSSAASIKAMFCSGEPVGTHVPLHPPQKAFLTAPCANAPTAQRARK